MKELEIKYQSNKKIIKKTIDIKTWKHILGLNSGQPTTFARKTQEHHIP